MGRRKDWHAGRFVCLPCIVSTFAALTHVVAPNTGSFTIDATVPGAGSIA